MPTEIRVEKFYWSMPDDLLARTHGGQVPGPLTPPGITGFAGTSVSSMLGMMMTIRDESGAAVGIASELEVWPVEGTMVDLMQAAGPATDIRCQVWFSIVTRDRGALFGYETKDLANPTMSSLFGNVAQSGKEWTGDVSVVTTNGPVERKGIVVGGTGDFSGAKGTFTQTIEIRHIPVDGMTAMTACEEYRLEFEN